MAGRDMNEDRTVFRQRRTKRDRNAIGFPSKSSTVQLTKRKKKKVKRSSASTRHSKDKPSGGVEALLPSFIGLVVLAFAVMAQRGFRGRASVAGIDLGTTNSVICIQAPSKSVGEILCIEDPSNGSPIVPSVVSFLEPHERKVGQSSKTPSQLDPHPSHVVVGHQAKQRIESHPHQTLYHAKRVLGRPYNDEAVRELRDEVEFDIVDASNTRVDEGRKQVDSTRFQIPSGMDGQPSMMIPPVQVGSYVVNHLMQLAKDYLGHDNVKSAVLAVPAKFDSLQRQRTLEAFRDAGIRVVRVLEEPTAAVSHSCLEHRFGTVLWGRVI